MQARLWGDSALPSVVTVSSSLPVGTLRPQGGAVLRHAPSSALLVSVLPMALGSWLHKQGAEKGFTLCAWR